MKSLRMLMFLGVAALLLLLTVGQLPQAGAQEVETRKQAAQLMKDGNWKEAYAKFAQLALDPQSDPKEVSSDLTNALNCLYRLGNQSEVDAFREKVVTGHGTNWRLLWAAARSYLDGNHYGYIVSGEFQRGNHRGGGRYVNVYERDRIRSLQLMVQATRQMAGETDRAAMGNFYWQFAEMLMGNRGYNQAWRLQVLTNLDELPDYGDDYSYGGGGWRGAPVQDDGTPIYYKAPATWAAAENDGQRWRWALKMTAETNPARAAEVTYAFAGFLNSQFGVQTMSRYGRYFAMSDDDKVNESGTFALHTLKETETIAQLASGIKRFILPEEYNYIKIYQQLTQQPNAQYARYAQEALGQIFEDRRQYDRAAEYWKLAGRQDRVEQILGNWGMFDPSQTQPAGDNAQVEFRFRNGNKVNFVAQKIDVAKLLADVQAYIKSKPRQLDWEKMDIARLGYRLVEKNQTQYLAGKVAEWSLDLTPRANHFDKLVTVTTPLKDGGAYLLTGTMAGGNTSSIILWVADTVIVKKPLDNAVYYYVADAKTGQPIPNAKLDFFGYKQDWVREGNGGYYNVTTKAFSKTTDADGQTTTGAGDQGTDHQWIITATAGDRMAYLGFTNIWFNNYHDQEYNQTKTFVITDRPVYRPGQTVKFKFWVNHAKYDQEGKSAFAGRQCSVVVTNAKSEEILKKNFTADDFGGFDGELALPKDAALGVYNVALAHEPYGGSSFRVEEYKKPEFEVSVEAPTIPVMLGEKITATVKAKYYFGAPVTNAKVTYKVTRSSYSANWYPADEWDWFYGKGYWWYGYDYAWYPGWRDWGCLRPVPVWWWGWRGQPQPELVAEGDLEIGEDGTAPLEIDTAFAKAVLGDQDHSYQISVEVTDQSRRTIVGQGNVLVARKPFKVYAWVDRGHYRVGDAVQASFSAQTLDNRPVKGRGTLRLLAVTYPQGGKPVETEVQRWKLDTDAAGKAKVQLKASKAGQYRLSYVVQDNQLHQIEGGYVFVVRGDKFDGSDYRFNDIELVTDKREYAPGEPVNLMVNTNRENATVLLFARPANGVYLAPKVLRLNGKSALEALEITKKDMPNCYVEAVTVSDGKVFTDMREVAVPPEQRIIHVDVTPTAATYKPGEKATMKVKLTDVDGKPFQGSAVVSIYDKSVEYIAGGSNVPEIRSFYWAWRRQHSPNTEHSLNHYEANVRKSGVTGMSYLGVFGATVVDELADGDLEAQDEWSAHRTLHEVGKERSAVFNGRRDYISADGATLAAAAPMAKSLAGPAGPAGPAGAKGDSGWTPAEDAFGRTLGDGGGTGMVQPTVRSNFADTALWVGCLNTDAAGTATVTLTMPENLTTWKTKVWAMGNGTAVGEGETEVTTAKNLIVRLQAPRFFVQKDEVVLSANVHNYLKTAKKVQAVLDLDEKEGAAVTPLGAKYKRVAATSWSVPQTITIPAGGEKRVDWRITVDQPGQLVVRMKALTNEESDAMEMTFPVYVHGMLKTESFSGAIRPNQQQGAITLRVPTERRPEQSRLEVRYSPTLAGAMVDAIPYLVSYPYEHTESTVNRFLPTVLTQRALLRMGVNLREIKDKRTNINAQEIGDDVKRAEDWKRQQRYWEEAARNPVFDEATVQSMVRANIERLTSMQCGDGGWGWFSGYGERSYPHTTAVVVHGLQVARANGVNLPNGLLEGGVQWLANYQAEEVRRLKLPETDRWHKRSADNLDAMVYMVLVDDGKDNGEMRNFLYRDRNNLAVYAKALFGIALHMVKDFEKRDMLARNIDQYLVQDDENQTAYLKLPNDTWWWCWYGSEIEANAYYLKLLLLTDPQGERAPKLVKYLLNNRKHATYWNSTRDTAIVLEAFADYLKITNEDQPNMTVTVMVDGKAVKQVQITRDNLFSFDNQVVLEGSAVTSGEHTVTLVKQGTGPLYYNAYLTNFTLEDYITKAGLEVKVNRKYFKLIKSTRTVAAEGSRGQVVNQAVEKYERQPLADLATLKSGDLVEVELTIESKNDYEYLLFEDMKAAGFEPMEVRSGYGNNEMGAYMELRDERVCFFVQRLARGTHSLSYRLRAEIPGKFSVLPTKASAVYAPELKANSDEIKLKIED